MNLGNNEVVIRLKKDQTGQTDFFSSTVATFEGLSYPITLSKNSFQMTKQNSLQNNQIESIHFPVDSSLYLADIST